MRKKLIETLEFQSIALHAGVDVSLDNMIASWGAVPYPHLSVLLVHLRFLAMVHQTHHWQAQGDSFYGDHLLFERLYGAVSGEIDQIAEKAVGLGCIDNVSLVMQAQQVMQLAQSYGVATTIPTQSDLAMRSLHAELGLLRCIDHCVCCLKDLGSLTRGLDNMLAGMEDVHEGHVYLLKQRCAKE